MSKEANYHRAFGNHSGIPKCCIEYFINEWDKYKLWENRPTAHSKAVEGLGWGYVPCPRCLRLKRKAKVLDCDSSCGGQHWKDFYSKGEI